MKKFFAAILFSMVVTIGISFTASNVAEYVPIGPSIVKVAEYVPIGPSPIKIADTAPTMNKLMIAEFQPPYLMTINQS